VVGNSWVKVSQAAGRAVWRAVWRAQSLLRLNGDRESAWELRKRSADDDEDDRNTLDGAIGTEARKQAMSKIQRTTTAEV
jgi:hypothetical protein